MIRHAMTNEADELTAKIFAYVEREAGRDAPLSPEDELMVRNLLQTDQVVQAIADDFRSTNTALDDLLDTRDIEIPDKLVSLILTHGGLDTENVGDQEGTGQIIPFAPPPAAEKKMWVYRPLAAAASIAFVIAGGGLLYQYEASDQERLQFQAKLAEADTALANRTVELQQVQTAQRGLRLRLASLTTEKNHLEQIVAEAEAVREQFVAGLDGSTADLDSALAGIDSARSRRFDETEAGLDQEQFELRMAELSEALYGRDQELADTKTALTQANQEAAALAAERGELIEQGQTRLTGLEEQLITAHEEVANLVTERDNLAGKVTQSRNRISALEDRFNATLGKIVGLNTASNQLAAEKERYRKEASWLNQVAGYHRGYAGTMREVEISAEEQESKQMLTKWLASMIGRDFPMPDLSSSDLIFVGGRVFFVNGKPTGQIAYHDEEGRLTGFCFTANPDKLDSAPTRGEDGDLNLISWSKNGIDYVLVGWTAAPELEWIAKGLQRTYGDEI